MRTNFKWMVVSRFAILFMIFYIASNLYGFSLINPSEPTLTGWGKWIMNTILGLLTSSLFAILWSFKTVADQMNIDKELKL